MPRLSVPGASLLALALVACQPTYDAPRTSLRLHGAPPDAIVIVDDQPIAPLRVVEKRGLSLTRGRHRISIEREGYFPFDRAIDAGDDPVQLDVQLTRLPD
jgi:hypothetical protein